MTNPNSAAKRWRCFLIENTFIRNHKIFAHVKVPNALMPDIPFLDKALPGLLLIKAVSMFDEFLKEYIKKNSLTQPKSFRTDLNGRIEFLKSLNLIKNADALHDLRKVRNGLAHDATESVHWETYENGTSEIHDALSSLKIVNKQLGKFSCKAERAALDTTITDPKIFGTFKYTVTVLENNKRAGEVVWKENILED